MPRLGIVSALALAGFLAAASAHACGGWYQDPVLGSDYALLQAPTTEFGKELARLKPAGAVAFKPVMPEKKDIYRQDCGLEDYCVQTEDAESVDLAEALRARGLDAAAVSALVEKYAHVRGPIRAYAAALDQWNRYEHWDETKKKPEPHYAPLTVSDGRPEEFGLYLEGASLYYQGKAAEARLAWLKLLQLDPAQRHWRSTWAAYMIGRSFVETDPEKALGSFQQVRQLAKAGFADTLGLAEASLGWEARALLNMKPARCAEAIRLYLVQYAAGDERAIPSLQRAAAFVLTLPDSELTKFAADEPARRVVTAYLTGRGGPWMTAPSAQATGKWLVAVEAAKVTTAEDAERFAEAAYQSGQMDAAERWLKLAPPDSVMTRWLGAKLLLRAGKTAEAREVLAGLAARLPVLGADDQEYDVGEPQEGACTFFPVERKARWELGALDVARGRYAEALATLLAGDNWIDSAYLAERVMTIDELKAFVDRECPPLAAPSPNDPKGWHRASLRHLLARRLARLGRYDEAKPYYPAEVQPKLDIYARLLREGDDATLAADKRADSLWGAARLALYNGTDLFSMAVGWDPYDAYGRLGDSDGDPYNGRVPSKLAPPSADEKARVEKSRAERDKRFYYRYIAADLAWRAAELMPNDSDATAERLCKAGTWLKARDPKAADRFYKALVRRCGKTDLGREADRLRWFPKIDPLAP